MSEPSESFRTVEISVPQFEVEDLRWVTVKSVALGRRADVLIHATPAARSTSSAPVVILLHGVYGSHWSWCFQGGAHRTNARLQAARDIPPFILAMPSDGLWGDGGGYVRQRGGDFERWIVDEVPAAVARATERSTSSAPLFIAGLSMGGFGALRLAGKFPGRFAAASGHSSITDFAQMSEFVEEPLETFGVAEEDRSVLETLLRHRDRLPPLRFDCGTGDSLLAANRAVHEGLVAARVAHQYEEFSGAHTWEYWQTHLEDTLRFFAGVAAWPMADSPIGDSQ